MMENFIEIKSNRINLPNNLMGYNDLIRVHINKENKNKSFISLINKERRIFIPKDIREKLGITGNDKIKVNIEKIKEIKRKKEIIKNNKFISLALIPEKTKSNLEIFIVGSKDKKLLSYCFTQGGVRKIKINKNMPIKFSRCLGYYQAEGGKNKLIERRGRTFSLTNTSIDLIKDFIYLVDYFIDKDILNCSIYFNKEIDINLLNKIKKNLIDVGIKKEKIKFYKAEKLKNYSIQIWVANSLLADIFNEIVNKTRNLLINESNPLSDLYLFFIRGLLAGDGLLTKNRDKLGSLHSKLYLYEGNKILIEDYKKIFDKIGFNGKINKDKKRNMYILIININWDRLLQLIELDLLKEKLKDKEKLIWLIKNHKKYKSLKYFKELPNEFNINILIRIIKKEKVIIYNWISKRIKENLIEKRDINKWVITEKGINIKNILNKLPCNL